MKMNWFEYWIGHCWMSGWQSIRGAFKIWADLLSGNYKDYALIHTDDPLTECYEWFWVSLGEDNTYPREFLEYLYQLSEDVRTGKEPVIKYESLEDLMKEFE